MDDQIAPNCSQPNPKWPGNINALLHDILRFREQTLDPEGYRKRLAEAIQNAKKRPIGGSKEGGRK